MDSKKVVLNFVRTKALIPTVIFTIIPIFTIFGLIVLLCGVLPNWKRANRCVAQLEKNGELDKAATELISQNSKKFVKDKVVLTENFVFCKKTGVALPYNEVLWAYRHRQTNTFFFIPIKVTDSLYLAAKGMKPRMVASMGKDKKDQIKNAIIEIYNHNNSCLIGYTKENIATYKALSVK